MSWCSVSQTGYCEEPWKKKYNLTYREKFQTPLDISWEFLSGIINTGAISTLFQLPVGFIYFV
jgi:hypothetical protein